MFSTHFRKRNDEGVLLLDILIGIALLALIILLAVQTVSGLRARAYKAGTENDAKQLAMGLEAYITDTQAAPTTAGFAALLADGSIGYNATSGNSVAWYRAGTGGTLGNYVFCIEHSSGRGAALYNSLNGAIVDSVSDRDCGSSPGGALASVLTVPAA